jgi:hypothetical protein
MTQKAGASCCILAFVPYDQFACLRRNPNWSLGSYVSTKLVRHGGDESDTSKPLKRVIDYYEGGQWCDETLGTRSTEVHIKCCRSHGHDTKTRFASEREKLGHITRIDGIHEASVCAYKMVVCTELLCSSPDMDNGKITLVDVMAEMNGSCVVKYVTATLPSTLAGVTEVLTDRMIGGHTNCV